MTSPEKPTLCLHVGYGKTGSTAIQHWLASQQQALEAAGVAYPIPETGIGDSGNGFLLLEALAQPHQCPWWLNQAQSNLRGWLFSREQFARELSEPGRCEQLAAWAERWGFGSVQMLLFVRDPREHCYSLWAQKVKRAGERRSLHAFADDYDAVRMVTSFLQNASGCGLRVRIFDYGARRDNLLACMEEHLRYIFAIHHKLPDSTSGLSQKYNLTPCQSQLRLQRHLNKLWPSGPAPLPPKYLAKIMLGSSQLNFEQNSIILDQWRSEVSEFNSLRNKNIHFLDYMPCL